MIDKARAENKRERKKERQSFTFDEIDPVRLLVFSLKMSLNWRLHDCYTNDMYIFDEFPSLSLRTSACATLFSTIFECYLRRRYKCVFHFGLLLMDTLMYLLNCFNFKLCLNPMTHLKHSSVAPYSMFPFCDQPIFQSPFWYQFGFVF